MALGVEVGLGVGVGVACVVGPTVADGEGLTGVAAAMGTVLDPWPDNSRGTAIAPAITNAVATRLAWASVP